jgi:hypothetical protein
MSPTFKPALSADPAGVTSVTTLRVNVLGSMENPYLWVPENNLYGLVAIEIETKIAAANHTQPKDLFQVMRIKRVSRPVRRHRHVDRSMGRIYLS